MKLLICTQIIDRHDPTLGFFHDWVEEFARHFSVVYVICLKKGRHTLPDNVQVFSLGKEHGENRSRYIIRFYRFFSTIFLLRKVDYVFFHMGAIYNILAAPFFLVRKIFGTKFYWWKTHGHINVWGRVALMFVDRVYTAAAESFPIKTRKRHVVGHAIDVSRFAVEREVHESTLLFVGRISRVKRIEQVIRVTQLLIQMGVPCTTKIVGSIVDEEYYSELEALTKELGVGDAVKFVPGVSYDRIGEEYRRALICINPSDTDGVDKVVLEAMASGTIPVTANLSFEHMLSPFGLFMKKGDIDGYAQCIQGIVRMERDARKALGAQLQNIVCTEHSLKTLSERIFPSR